jgi:signal transduction histidine kinase
MSKRDKVNILMVDDQPAKLLSYEVILSSLDENLVRANSGKEALDHLLKTDFAVVLMDVSMPDIDGFKLAEMIRQHPRFEKTAIILISAIHLTDLDRLKGYEVGAVDYIPVPVVPEIMRAKVGVFADLYRKTRQLERLNLELETRVAERTADLEASAARLQEADRRKDQFLATLAHELRNPLAPIASAAKVLRLKATNDPDLQWSQQVIDRQVAHLARLVDDLLDVSRISRNKLELRKQRVELAVILNAAVESSRSLMQKRGHEFNMTLPDVPVYLNADTVRLSQVFTNLLNNSAKFTGPDGRISLAARADGNSVFVSVSDTGIGISPEELPQIWELFYQLDTALEGSYGGLGVGLSLVRQLVDMHGGSVEAYSEGLGKGSEFVVCLPVLQEASEHAQLTKSAAHAEAAAHPGVRILIADDNEDSANTLALLLRLEGYVIALAYNGIEALEVGDRFQPEVAVLDIGMPKLNGYEVAQRIRERPWGTNVLLIAQSGWGREEDVRRSKEAGFNVHLTKPPDFDALNKLLADFEPASKPVR